MIYKEREEEHMKQYEQPLMDAYEMEALDVITLSVDKTGTYDPETDDGGWS